MEVARSMALFLAAHGGVFVAGSLAWGMALDGFRPTGGQRELVRTRIVGFTGRCGAGPAGPILRAAKEP